MDDLHDEIFQSGRKVGTANAVSALCRVAERYRNIEQHEAWMALMEAIREIQESEQS